MTSRPTHHARRPTRGFTLVEMLVVIGILALLASISFVVLSKATKSANKTRISFQFQAISAALEAYKTDFNSFPITTVDTSNSRDIDRDGLRGARTLCKALMGPTGAFNSAIPVATDQNQDGKEGLGFAVVGRSGLYQKDATTGDLKGKSYGPYLVADKFPISRTKVDGLLETAPYTATEKFDDTAVLLDGAGSPILYYPVLNPQPPVQLQYAYVSRGFTRLPSATQEPAGTDGYIGAPMYNSTDNDFWLSAPLFRKILGDANGDGRINPATATTPAETPAVRGKYILYSAGVDGRFGPNTDPNASAKERADFDDVTNFQGE